MRRNRIAPTGFTLIEALIASSLLSFVVVAITHAIVAGQGQTHAALHASRGLELANALLEEAVSKPWDDPEGASSPGPEGDEPGRADFDNLDDYHGYTETPGGLADAAGEPYGPLHQRFTRSVTVSAATLGDPTLGDRAGVLVTVSVTGDRGRTWAMQRFVGESAARLPHAAGGAP